jgi:hypothetical protein
VTVPGDRGRDHDIVGRDHDIAGRDHDIAGRDHDCAARVRGTAPQGARHESTVT